GAALVAGRSDDERAIALCRNLDRVAERLRVEVAAEAEAYHSGAMLGCPQNPVGDRRIAAAEGAEHLDGDDARREGGSGDAEAVVRRSRRDAGRVGAVSRIVEGRARRTHSALVCVDAVGGIRGVELRDEVRMRKVDTRIDDADGRTAAEPVRPGKQRPAPDGLSLRKCPL